MEEVEIGQTYIARSELLTHHVSGEVQVKYINSCLIAIVTYDSDDCEAIYDLEYKVVVKYKDMSFYRNVVLN